MIRFRQTLGHILKSAVDNSQRILSEKPLLVLIFIFIVICISYDATKISGNSKTMKENRPLFERLKLSTIRKQKNLIVIHCQFLRL